jgi:hypothetical protein
MAVLRNLWEDRRRGQRAATAAAAEPDVEAHANIQHAPDDGAPEQQDRADDGPTSRPT